jgi:hypothetical protein
MNKGHMIGWIKMNKDRWMMLNLEQILLPFEKIKSLVNIGMFHILLLQFPYLYLWKKLVDLQFYFFVSGFK